MTDRAVRSPIGCKPRWLSEELAEPLHVRCRDLVRAQGRRVDSGRPRRAEWDNEIEDILDEWEAAWPSIARPGDGVVAA